MTNDLIKTKNILTIAGSDILSGGGMQADLATFAHYGLYGFCALTSIVTVHGDKFYVHAVEEEVFQEELDSLEEIPFSAIKIGLLPNKKILELTASFLEKQAAPIILDPVIVFKENADYSVNEIRDFFIERLIPLADIITPNLKEAEILVDFPIKSLDDMKQAAQLLHDFGAKNVVIKGGTRFDDAHAIDLSYDGTSFTEFSNPVLDKNNNGAGCTFASAIASTVAQEFSFENAVKASKDFVYESINNSNEFGVFQNKK